MGSGAVADADAGSYRQAVRALPSASVHDGIVVPGRQVNGSLFGVSARGEPPNGVQVSAPAVVAIATPAIAQSARTRAVEIVVIVPPGCTAPRPAAAARARRCALWRSAAA